MKTSFFKKISRLAPQALAVTSTASALALATYQMVEYEAKENREFRKKYPGMEPTRTFHYTGYYGFWKLNEPVQHGNSKHQEKTQQSQSFDV